MIPQVELNNCSQIVRIEMRYNDLEQFQRLIQSGQVQVYTCDIYTCLPLVKTATDFEQIEISKGQIISCQGQSQNKVLNKQELVSQAVKKFKKQEEDEQDDNNLALSSTIKYDLNQILDQMQQPIQNQIQPIDDDIQRLTYQLSQEQLQQAEQQVQDSFVQLYSIDPSMIQEQLNQYWLNKKITPDKDICESYKHAKLSAYSEDIIYQCASQQRYIYQQLQSNTPISFVQDNINLDQECMFSNLYTLTQQVGQIKNLSKIYSTQFIQDFVLPFHEKCQYIQINPPPSQDFIYNYQTQLQWFNNWKLQYGPQLLEQKMLQLGPVVASLLLTNKLSSSQAQQLSYLSNSSMSTKPIPLTRIDLYDNNQFETVMTTSNEIYPNPVNPSYEAQCGNLKLELIVSSKKGVNEIRTFESDAINDEYQRISCQQNKQQEIVSYLGQNCCISMENSQNQELQFGFNEDQLFVDQRQDKKGYCKPHIIFVDQLHSSNEPVFTEDYPIEEIYQTFINDLESDKKFVLSQFFSKFKNQIIQGLKQVRQNQIHIPNDQRVPVVTNLSALTLIKDEKIQNWQSFATHDINTQLLQLIQNTKNTAQQLGIQYHMSFATLSQEFLELIDQVKLNPDCNSKQFQVKIQQIATMEKQITELVQNNQVAIESLYPYVISKMQQLQNQADLIEQVKLSDIYHQKWLKFISMKVEEAYHSKNIQIDQIIDFFRSLHIQEFYWYEIVQIFNDKVLKQQMKTLLAGYFAGLQIKYQMRKLSYEAQQFGLKPQKIQRTVKDFDAEGNEVENVTTQQLFWWYGTQNQETGEYVSCKQLMYITALKTLVIEMINKFYQREQESWSELQGYINNNFNFMTKNIEEVTYETIFGDSYQLKYLFLQQIIDTIGIQFQQYITVAYLQQNNWKLCTTDILQFIPVIIQNEWSQISNKILTQDNLLNLQKQVLCEINQPSQLNADLLVNDSLLLKQQLEPGYQHNNLIMNIKQFILQQQADQIVDFHSIPVLVENLIRCDQLYIQNKLNDSLLNVNQLVENIKFETVLNQFLQYIARNNSFNKILELNAIELNQHLIDHINQVIKELKKRTPTIENNQVISNIISIAEQQIKMSTKSPLAISRQTYINNSISQIYFICEKVNKLIEKENYMSAASLIEMYLEEWTQQNLGLPLVEIICVLASIYSKMGRHMYAIEIYKQGLQRLQSLIEVQRNLIIQYTENVPQQQLWQTMKIIQKQEGNKFILSIQNKAQQLFIIRAQLVNNICKTACKAYAFSFLGDLINELKNMLTLFSVTNQTQISSSIITDMIYTIAKTYELMQKNSDAIIYYEMILKTRVIVEVSQNIHCCILKMQNKNVTVIQNKIADVMQTHYIILKKPEIESVLREILCQQNITQYIIQLYDQVQQMADIESARKLILLQCYLRGDSIEEEQKVEEESKDDYDDEDYQEQQQQQEEQIQDVTAQEVAQEVIQD